MSSIAKNASPIHEHDDHRRESPPMFEYGDVLDDDMPHINKPYINNDLGGEDAASASASASAVLAATTAATCGCGCGLGVFTKRGLLTTGFMVLVLLVSSVTWWKLSKLRREIEQIEPYQHMNLDEKYVQCIVIDTIERYINNMQKGARLFVAEDNEEEDNEKQDNEDKYKEEENGKKEEDNNEERKV